MMNSADHSSSSSSSPPNFSCPCKRIPLSLSSATSAEYGDVASLARRLKKGNSSTVSRGGVGVGVSGDGGGGGGGIPTDGGITPLHLAAQHGHPAAVSLLLREGGCDVDTGLLPSSNRSLNHDTTNDSQRTNTTAGGGATPLHRAAFSGAISSMQILLSWGDDNENDNPPQETKKKANLLAKDTSFGDQKTPLHKAVAGGRPLAVQLLMDALRHRNLLREALRSRDAGGRTPLQLARQFASLRPEEKEEERRSVRRWDVVAGGDAADWDTCLRLLEGAYYEPSASSSLPDNADRQLKRSANVTTANMNNATRARGYCDDGMADCREGKCVTAIWERAFRSSLFSSMEMSLNSTICTVVPTNKTNVDDNDDDGDALSIPRIDTTTTAATATTTNLTSANNDQNTNDATNPPPLQKTCAPMGRQCDACGKISPALFRSANHQLVCRSCRRLGRRRS